ncbi:MAG: hypothetical protein M5U26_14395 [Planctomycetota bacterium]|nr:hypothetical protein [Planctomycetota bacterium]
MRTIAFLGGLLYLSAAVAGAVEVETDLDALVTNLNHEDYQVREAATKRLAELVPTHLDRILKIEAETKEPEVRTRINEAINREVRTKLAAQREATEKKLAAANQEYKELQADTEALLEKLAKEQAQAEQREVSLAEQVKLKKELENARLAFRLEKNKLDSNLDQLRQALEEIDALSMENRKRLLKGEAFSRSWLPFKERCKSRVSFEFVDMPLADAVAFLASTAGVKIETPPDFAAKTGQVVLALRVSDMDLLTSLGWVCRLANKDFRVDEEQEKIKLGFPKGE